MFKTTPVVKPKKGTKSGGVAEENRVERQFYRTPNPPGGAAQCGVRVRAQLPSESRVYKVYMLHRETRHWPKNTGVPGHSSGGRRMECLWYSLWRLGRSSQGGDAKSGVHQRKRVPAPVSVKWVEWWWETAAKPMNGGGVLRHGRSVSSGKQLWGAGRHAINAMSHRYGGAGRAAGVCGGARGAAGR